MGEENNCELYIGDILISDEIPDLSDYITYDDIQDMHIDSHSLEISLENIGGSLKDLFLENQGFQPCIMIGKINTLVQARTHKKRRINKKWLKRYGYRNILKNFEAKIETIDIENDSRNSELVNISGDISEMKFMN